MVLTAHTTAHGEGLLQNRLGFVDPALIQKELTKLVNVGRRFAALAEHVSANGEGVAEKLLGFPSSADRG